MKKLREPSLATLLESYFRNRLTVQRRASPATIASYRDALKLFLVFASQRCGKPPNRLTLADLDREVVLDFLDHLEKGRGNSIRTRNARLTAIRAFFQYVAFCDPASLGIVQRVRSVEGKRSVKRLVNHLSAAELEAVLAAPDRRLSRGRRDYALLLFLVRTGARVSEAVGVNRDDLRLVHPRQVLLRGKGSKERVVPLDEGTACVLRDLCTELRLGSHDPTPVFVNGRSQRLTRFGVVHIVRRAVALASRAHPSLTRRSVSPHTFRHSTAMALLQSGVDLAVIRSWLGHVSLDTTHHYVEADVEMKRRALEKCALTDEKPARYRPTDALLAMLDEL